MPAGRPNPALYATDPPGSQRKKILRTGNAAVSLRRATHGTRAQTMPFGDALARYMWMNGYNVLSSHGLGRVWAARRKMPLSRIMSPRSSGTLSNIAHMKAQMKRLGFAYDWSREVATCFA